MNDDQGDLFEHITVKCPKCKRKYKRLRWDTSGDPCAKCQNRVDHDDWDDDDDWN